MVEIQFLNRELQEIREMRKTMDFFNDKHEEESKQKKVICEMVPEISDDNQDLRKEVQKLKYSLNFQENNKLKTNICISGLLNAIGVISSSKEKIINLIQELNVDIVQRYSQNIKLLQKRDESCCYKTLNMKQEILKARANKEKITKLI